MGARHRKPAAGGTASGSSRRRSGDRRELFDIPAPFRLQGITTPKDAVREMLAAGAIFTIHRRRDGLSSNFTFRVSPGGDLMRCRSIIAEAKCRPPQFLAAFKAEVERVVAE